MTGGSAVALVVRTGLGTQIGQVQRLVGDIVQRETPMQKQLNHLGLQLAIGAGGACVAVFGIGLLRGYPLLRSERGSQLHGDTPPAKARRAGSFPSR